MDRQCPQASMTGANARSVCGPAAPTITAKPMAIFWSRRAMATLLCAALCAGLFAAVGAQVRASTTPKIYAIQKERSGSRYLIDGIAPFDPACLDNGQVGEVSLPPQMQVYRVTYVRAFCTGDGNGNGRLTLNVSGDCRLVQYQGVTLESWCHWLPIVMR